MHAVLAVLVLVCGCGAHWSNRDMALESASVAINMVDAHQSLAVTNAGAEMNPVIGSHGERVGVLTFALTAAVLHAIVTDAMPPKWRTAWQCASIGLEGAIVMDNWTMGYSP